MSLYEIGYENDRCSGTQLVRAKSREEAVTEFTRRWQEYGDSAPECWVIRVWSED